MSKIIDALRQAADMLDVDSGMYNFVDFARCQIGFLTQIILHGDVTDKDSFEVYGNKWDDILFDAKYSPLRTEEEIENGTTWRDIANEVERCQVTGTPIYEVIQTLLDSGLTPQMIRDIEAYGDNPQIAANYMRRLASELELEYEHH